MTPATLKSYSHKDLAEMAKQGGVRGWHAMRKDQLVKALLANSLKRGAAKSARVAKKLPAPVSRSGSAKSPVQRQRQVAAATTNGAKTNGASQNGAAHSNGAASASRAGGANRAAASRPINGAAHATNGAAHATNGAAHASNGVSANGAARKVAARPAATPAPRPVNRRVVEHLRQVKARVEVAQNLANGSDASHSAAARKDRIIVMVRDCYWLHAYWEVTRQSVERAKAAMGQDWHLARPALRVLEVTDGGAMSASERISQEIEIHGGVSNWYIHVLEPPRSYRVEIGYLGRSGKFFAITRSNVVTTPTPGSSDALDDNWADVARNFEKIYAMSGGYAAEKAGDELQELFEERLRRPMGTSMSEGYVAGMEGMFAMPKDLALTVDAEMIIYGATRSDARVTMRGEPVKLRPDGTFTVRMSLPNHRQVIPVVAHAAGGAEQRTVVLAVERNTKIMEPVVREASLD